MLVRALGDRHTFTVTNPSGASRTYKRFSAAAYEEGISRIYCGIHFRSAMNTGFVTGALIARYADTTRLRGRYRNSRATTRAAGLPRPR